MLCTVAGYDRTLNCCLMPSAYKSPFWPNAVLAGDQVRLYWLGAKSLTSMQLNIFLYRDEQRSQ
jgi:hypothetical protein